MASSFVTRKCIGLDVDGQYDSTEFVKEWKVKTLDYTAPDVPMPDTSVSEDVAEELRKMEKEGADIGNQTSASGTSENSMNTFLRKKMGFSISSEMSSATKRIIGTIQHSDNTAEHKDVTDGLWRSSHVKQKKQVLNTQNDVEIISSHIRSSIVDQG